MILDYNAEIANIQNYYAGYKNYIEVLIREKISEIMTSQNGNIALVCAGEHTLHLVEEFKEELKNVSIIDRNANREEVRRRFPGHNLCEYSEICKFKCLIISSRGLEKKVTDYLKELDYKGEIIGIYGTLEQEKIYMPTEYYHINMSPYIPAIIARKCYKSGKKIQECLKYLIYNCLENRDLLKVKNYLHEYIGQDFDDKEMIQNTLRQIIKLENQLKKEMHSRKQRDIYAFWLDGLRYKLSLEMPYLSRCRELGLDFINAYTSSISTRHTYGCMMKSSDEIGLFLSENQEDELLEVLNEYDYEAYRLGATGCTYLKEYRYKTDALLNDEVATTKLLWNMCMTVRESEKPVFILGHLSSECHAPFISPETDMWDRNNYFDYNYWFQGGENYQNYLSGVLVSAKYLDEQLQYYGQFLSEHVVKIYFADHGYAMNRDVKQYKEDMAHIPFCVVGEGIRMRKENRLIGTKHMSKIIKYAITKANSDYDLICEDVLQINGIDAYNKDWICVLIRIGAVGWGIQYNGIRTEKDLYVLEATGEEAYYVLPDEENNRISESKYSDRIGYLRDMLDKKFIDINKHPKFINSHMVYDYLGKKFIGDNGGA